MEIDCEVQALEDFDHIATEADALIKPDMPAVLERTNLSVNVQGFLLPVFEALSNSMDGIEQRFQDRSSREGKILVKFENLNDPDNVMISITDNRVGLNEENYKSFRTPFSGYKLSKRGRGFGRFIAFKVFSRIHYSSRFENALAEETKTFRFDISQDEEIIFHDGEPDFSGCGLCVELDDPLQDWFELVGLLSKQNVKDQIGSHFLPYFLYRFLPEISLQFDDEEPENITSYFKAVFVEHATGQIDAGIDGVTCSLDYTLTKIPKTRQFKSHCLLFAAADRIVGHPRDLSNKLGASHFVDEDDSKFIIVAVVRGNAFETRLNDSRTSLDLPPKAVEDIVGAVCGKIQDREKQQIEKIKSGQAQKLNLALHENPKLGWASKESRWPSMSHENPITGGLRNSFKILRCLVTGTRVIC